MISGTCSFGPGGGTVGVKLSRTSQQIEASQERLTWATLISPAHLGVSGVMVPIDGEKDNAMKATGQLLAGSSMGIHKMYTALMRP